MELPSSIVPATATMALIDDAMAAGEPVVESMQRTKGARIGAGSATEAIQTRAALARAPRS